MLLRSCPKIKDIIAYYFQKKKEIIPTFGSFVPREYIGDVAYFCFMKGVTARPPDLINRERIAPCGMDCALCIAISRKKDPCPGCRGPDEGKPKYCVQCKMVICDLAPEGPEGKFCFTCDSFPCRRLKDLDKRYRTKYSMSMLENLAFIRDNGLDRFIEKEKKRWICKECGGAVSVHRDNCINCGHLWRTADVP